MPAMELIASLLMTWTVFSSTSSSGKLKSAIGYNTSLACFNYCFRFGVCMSSELKTMLNKVLVEDSKRKETEFEEGIDRYKSLLLKIAKDKTPDMIISFEGTEHVI
jgi:hypothetical protein